MTSVQPPYSIRGLTNRWSALSAALFFVGFIIAGGETGL